MQYQSVIVALQWIVTIDWFDINTTIITMSGLHMASRVEHLNRLKYLLNIKHASIRVRTEDTDYSDLPDNTYDLTYTVYEKVKELVPEDAPQPLGKYMTLSHCYVDANLLHDVVMGRSVTCILHLVNKTPIEWYSKKQAIIETATYGSIFIAVHVCVEQIIHQHNTLKYLGVPIRDKSYMLFGDNNSMVDSCMQRNAKLHMWHSETIASGILGFYFLPGEDNPADILEKHWGYTQIKKKVKDFVVL
jgi:hypothetical protein